MTKIRYCRCGKELKFGRAQLCKLCREKENEYMKTLRKTNMLLDKSEDLI